jgi:hypothetical protein
MRDAKPDAAIAAGDDRDAACEIENVHLAFPVFCMTHIRCPPPSMDKPAWKIKYGMERPI